MDRRAFIATVGVNAFAAALIVKAQTAARVYRLGILHSGATAPADPVVANANAFLSPLRELGYVEGRNLIVERRYAEGNYDQLPGLARELVKLPVEVMLAVGLAAIQAARNATTTVPIVLLTNSDPVAAGLFENLSRPGGNVTGVLIAPEGTLAGKKLELLKEAVPQATRIALLLPRDPTIGMEQQRQEVRKAAQSLAVGLVIVEVVGGDYDGAFAAISAGRAQALFVAAHSSFIPHRKKIIELAAKYRLPAIYEWPLYVQDGGLMSYGASDVETYKQVAAYIDRLFKGAKPSDLPIWQPSKLHLVINLKTAKTLGITISQSLLLRADEVIQ